MNRRAGIVLTTAALTVTLASPAAAQMLRTGHVEGTIATVNTRTNRITLTDGTGVRYRPGDTFATTRIYDIDEFECDVEDRGGPTSGTTEANLERLLIPGGRLTADVEKHRRDGASFFYVVVNTCDGVIDATDTTP